MINLLPPQQKEELLEQERLKITLILGILFLSFLLSLTLIFLAIKNYVSWNLGVQKMSLEEKEKIASLNQDIKKEIKETNLSLSNLSSFYQEEDGLTQALEKISGTLPPETYLTSFNFSLVQREKESINQIFLSGFCPTREILLEFKKNLENVKGFSEIYFPPGNWVKPTNIGFNVSLRLD
ncbi:MAG: hypothetical protein ACE5J0_00805 [Candidatus Paceibacterales bacterium]